MLRKIMLAVGTALLPTIALAATIDVTTADIPAGTNVEWTADNEYLLNGLVFVSEGSSLTIQPGTVIKGKPGQGENASALVVARGGKIFARAPRISQSSSPPKPTMSAIPMTCRSTPAASGAVSSSSAGRASTPSRAKPPLKGFPPPSRAASTAATTTAITPASSATYPSATAAPTSVRATKSTA